MKKFFLLMIPVLALMGCGSGGDATENRARTNGKQTGSSTNASAATQSESNSLSPIPSQPAGGSNVETPTSRARESRLDAVRMAGVDPNAPKLDVEAVLRQSSRPAPENSDFAVALTDILVERRTFHSHPLLAKAEKVTEGATKTLRVFTRDGNVITLPGDAVPTLSTASSGAILKAAGIENPAARAVDKKPNAKPEN